MIYIIDNGRVFEDYNRDWVEFPARIGEWVESVEAVQKIVSIKDFEYSLSGYPGRPHYGETRVLAVLKEVEWVHASWARQWHEYLRPQDWLGDVGRRDDETGLWDYPNVPDVLDCHPEVLKGLLDHWTHHPLDPKNNNVWPGAFEAFRDKVLGSVDSSR